MTGEKNRYKTQEKLYNNDDRQLTTPKHDEMILWLLNKRNAVSIIPGLDIKLIEINYNNPIVQETGCIIQCFAERGYQITPNALKFFNRFNKDKIDGFIDRIDKIEPDLLVVGIEQINLCAELFINYGYIKIQSEVPINPRGGFIIGYLDILVTFLPTKTKYAIEVKPTVSSFGETLRQLNTYKSFFGNAEFFLCTSDLGFKGAFEDQGIKVLEYGR